MFNINDSIKCAIFIEGQEFALDAGNALQVLHITASTLFKLPTLHLEMLDVLNIMPSYALEDNAKITVVLKGLYDYTREFRVLRWQPQMIGAGFRYVIDGIWNAPRYWMGTDNAGMSGTSSTVLERIAKDCGLSVYETNAKTSDSMTWMQGNRSYSDFARHIARHGYVSDTSHMMLAVDSLGFMRYLDANKLTAPKIQASLTPQPAEGVLMLTDFKPVTRSGVSNALGGYRYETYTQQGDAASRISPREDALTYAADSRYPLINTKVREDIERGPIRFSPIDFGNVHENYERARYQNMRYNLVKSLSGLFLFPFQTPLEPGNQIAFTQTAGTKSTQYNGDYTVTEKTILIQGKSYNEKLVAMRGGLSE